ncbi:MAG TPA: hypothetical protein V6C76_06200 [Drouetiella sp.]
MVEKRVNRKVAHGITAVLTCLLTFAPVEAQGDTPLDIKPKVPLQAGIKHDETLPALPDQYQIGSSLDDVQLQPMVADNVWFPIPDWMAGSWHTENKTVDFVQDFTTGVTASPHVVVKESQDSIHGHQRDKSGRIWEYVEIPRVRKIGLANGSAYLRALREDVIVSDPNEVMLKFLTNQVTVGGKKQSILDSKQIQQFITYMPLEDGVIKINASLKNFDESGAPQQLQKSEALMNRTKPYENMDTLNGHDLKKLFADYLQKTGHADLIPN